MQKLLEKPKLDLRKIELENMNDKSLIALLWNLEELYSHIKKGASLFAHIITYFLFMTIVSLSSMVFERYLPNLPSEVYNIINFLFLSFGLFLIVKGIILYVNNEKFLKVLMTDINEIKKTVAKRNNTEDLSSSES